MRGTEVQRARLWLFGPAVVWVVLCGIGVLTTVFDNAAWSELDRTRSVPTGSARCAVCHPDQHATWFRSYHRTMTQRTEGPAVLAPFAGETLDTMGFRATMSRSDQGTPHLRIERLHRDSSSSPVVLDVDIELTVGSHRYQQYVARLDRGGGALERWRLPVAWHVALGRWIHLNEAFLAPEGAWGDQSDYLRHLSRWNDNCIFCHNTEPVPGLDAQGQWNTRVAELGIACEACHGAASAHLERHRSPLRRMLGAWTEQADGSVAQPGRLDAGRQADICGRCHGNRIAADIDKVLREGDGFVPGHPLSDGSRPIVRDATLGDSSQRPFAARFWPDGTPRLSAYEYQALLLSPCHTDVAGLGCGDCHTMHGPEPSMQLRPDYSAATVCGRCHPPSSLSDHTAQGGHGRHGERVGCEGCHLPRVTYGLLEGMMSHRPTRPRPADLLGRADQPDACTQCHIDRTRRWAADAGRAWSNGDRPSYGEPVGPSRVVRDLHGGDPIQRALAAHALTQRAAPVAPRRRMAWLVDALEDEYPAVRWFGYRGLQQIAQESEGHHAVVEALSDSTVIDDPGQRLVLIETLRQLLGPSPFANDLRLRQALRDRRDDRAIWIGE